MSGKLFGVGVGPGDKKMLTILAVETLKSSDIVALPDGGTEKTAFKIVEEYVEGKELLPCVLPMTRDEAELHKYHNQAADQICQKLDESKTVAFITLGDPTVYSTYMYIHRIVEKRGYETEIINGIPSFCAAAAKLGISLCDRSEPLHIIPASYDNTEELLALDGNKVLMKSGKQLEKVLNILKEKGQIEGVKMVECCGMENEKIYHNVEDVKESSYFSLIVVKN